MKIKENSKEQLQFFLDSTIEGILGIDEKGNCNYCNKTSLQLLGFQNQKELIGKNIHSLIQYKKKEEETFLNHQCKIYETLKTGKGNRVDDEVFLKKDGSSFHVEYYTYPLYEMNEIIGVIITFVNNTKWIKVNEEIKFLSYHDSLTGLYNRKYFEEESIKIDICENLPLSIIMGDANGLKLSNDIFGHEAGDILLIKVSKMFQKHCKETDIICRTGGDEFIVLMPKTPFGEAKEIMNRIKSELSKELIHVIKGSMSMGCETKEEKNQNLNEMIKNAENKMYLEKTLDRKNILADQLKTIIEIFQKRYPEERKHAENVSSLSQKIGRGMNLSKEEIKKLKDAGYLHDIGKIALDDDIVNKQRNLTSEEEKAIKQHAVLGFRILNYFDDTLDLANAILAHHERWDGTGYPKGLKGLEIPLIARIIAIAESYDAKIKDKEDKHKALQEIKSNAGIKFDPKIVKVLAQIVNESK